MTSCCPHEDQDHRIHSTCQEVTHYPSEDYPCLCTGFEGKDVCVKCDHPRAKHVARRVCAKCGCVTES